MEAFKGKEFVSLKKKAASSFVSDKDATKKGSQSLNLKPKPASRIPVVSRSGSKRQSLTVFTIKKSVKTHLSSGAISEGRRKAVNSWDVKQRMVHTVAGKAMGRVEKKPLRLSSQVCKSLFIKNKSAAMDTVPPKEERQVKKSPSPRGMKRRRNTSTSLMHIVKKRKLRDEVHYLDQSGASDDAYLLEQESPVPFTDSLIDVSSDFSVVTKSTQMSSTTKTYTRTSQSFRGSSSHLNETIDSFTVSDCKGVDRTPLVQASPRRSRGTPNVLLDNDSLKRSGVIMTSKNDSMDSTSSTSNVQSSPVFHNVSTNRKTSRSFSNISTKSSTRSLIGESNNETKYSLRNSLTATKVSPVKNLSRFSGIGKTPTLKISSRKSISTPKLSPIKNLSVSGIGKTPTLKISFRKSRTPKVSPVKFSGRKQTSSTPKEQNSPLPRNSGSMKRTSRDHSQSTNSSTLSSNGSERKKSSEIDAVQQTPNPRDSSRKSSPLKNLSRVSGVAQTSTLRISPRKSSSTPKLSPIKNLRVSGIGKTPTLKISFRKSRTSKVSPVKFSGRKQTSSTPKEQNSPLPRNSSSMKKTSRDHSQSTNSSTLSSNGSERKKSREIDTVQQTPNPRDSSRKSSPLKNLSRVSGFAQTSTLRISPRKSSSTPKLSPIKNLRVSGIGKTPVLKVSLRKSTRVSKVSPVKFSGRNQTSSTPKEQNSPLPHNFSRMINSTKSSTASESLLDRSDIETVDQTSKSNGSSRKSQISTTVSPFKNSSRVSGVGRTPTLKISPRKSARTSRRTPRVSVVEKTPRSLDISRNLLTDQKRRISRTSHSQKLCSSQNKLASFYNISSSVADADESLVTADDVVVGLSPKKHDFPRNSTLKAPQLQRLSRHSGAKTPKMEKSALDPESVNSSKRKSSYSIINISSSVNEYNESSVNTTNISDITTASNLRRVGQISGSLRNKRFSVPPVICKTENSPSFIYVSTSSSDADESMINISDVRADDKSHKIQSSFRKSIKTPKASSFKNLSGVGRLSKTPRLKISPRKSIRTSKVSPLATLSRLRGVKKTPKLQKSPKNDLTDVRGVKRIFGTPGVYKSPLNDLRNVSGVKKLLKTPKSPLSECKVSRIKTPKNDLTNVAGVKRLLRTPKERKSPKNDLTDLRGVKNIFKTPKQPKSPLNDLSNVSGVKKMMKTPKVQKSPKNDLTDLGGVKRLLRSPRKQKSPKNDLTDLRGVKNIFRTPKQPKSPLNDLSNVSGVKKIMKTPKNQKSPRNDLTDVRGVKRLLRTPKEQKSPKNDLTNVSGVKRIFKTPKIQKGPKNDLSDLRGVKNLLKTPKSPKSPKNDLGNVSGIKRLFKTPKQSKSDNLNNVSGVKELMKTPRELKSPNLSGVGLRLKTPRSPKSRLYVRLMASPKRKLNDKKSVRFRDLVLATVPSLQNVEKKGRGGKKPPIKDTPAGSETETSAPRSLRSRSKKTEVEQLADEASNLKDSEPENSRTMRSGRKKRDVNVVKTVARSTRGTKRKSCDNEEDLREEQPSKKKQLRQKKDTKEALEQKTQDSPPKRSRQTRNMDKKAESNNNVQEEPKEEKVKTKRGKKDVEKIEVTEKRTTRKRKQEPQPTEQVVKSPVRKTAKKNVKKDVVEETEKEEATGNRTTKKRGQGKVTQRTEKTPLKTRLRPRKV